MVNVDGFVSGAFMVSGCRAFVSGDAVMMSGQATGISGVISPNAYSGVLSPNAASGQTQVSGAYYQSGDTINTTNIWFDEDGGRNISAVPGLLNIVNNSGEVSLYATSNITLTALNNVIANGVDVNKAFQASGCYQSSGVYLVSGNYAQIATIRQSGAGTNTMERDGTIMPFIRTSAGTTIWRSGLCVTDTSGTPLISLDSGSLTCQEDGYYRVDFIATMKWQNQSGYIQARIMKNGDYVSGSVQTMNNIYVSGTFQCDSGASLPINLNTYLPMVSGDYVYPAVLTSPAASGALTTQAAYFALARMGGPMGPTGPAGPAGAIVGSILQSGTSTPIVNILSGTYTPYYLNSGAGLIWVSGFRTTAAGSPLISLASGQLICQKDGVYRIDFQANVWDFCISGQTQFQLYKNDSLISGTVVSQTNIYASGSYGTDGLGVVYPMHTDGIASMVSGDYTSVYIYHNVVSGHLCTSFSKLQMTRIGD